MASVRYFDFDKSAFEKDEQKVLEHLIKAGEVIHAIWEKQIDPLTGDLLLYPEDVTEEEVLDAAKDDPNILSAYTVVTKEGDEFVTTPYSLAYKDDLELFYKELLLAKESSSDKMLNEYIDKIIESFRSNNFEEALVAYLTNKSRIEFLCGPLETYEDKLLGKKKTFQYNLRVLQKEPTKEMSQMVEVMRNIHLKQPDTSVGSEITPVDIYIRIDQVMMFAGRQSKFLVSSTNLPNEPELVEKYGTKVSVYTTSMDQKFEKLHKPLLPFVVGDDLGDSVDQMKIAMFKGIALHEIAEGTVKFSGMADRLGKHIDYVRELNADLVGMDSAKYYVLNGIISLDEYRYLLASLLIFAIDMFDQFRETGELNDYVIGDAILFNRLFESGALVNRDSKVAIDFTRLAKDIEFLSRITIDLLEKGDQSDAEKFLDQYGDRNVFERLPKP